MRRGQGRVQGIRPKQERAAHELRVLVWGGNFAEMVIGERTLAVHNLFAVALLGCYRDAPMWLPARKSCSGPKSPENPLNCCFIQTFNTMPAIKTCLTADIFYGEIIVAG